MSLRSNRLLRAKKIDLEKSKAQSLRSEDVSLGTPIRDDRSIFKSQILKEFENDNQMVFEDGRETKAYFDRLKHIEWGCLTMSIAAIGLSVIEYDLEIDEVHANYALILLYVIFMFSVLLVILTIVRYYFYLEYKKKRHLVPPTATLISTNDYIPMITEVVLIMVIPYPWLQGIRVYTEVLNPVNGPDFVEIYYNVNEILQIFSLLRIIFTLRVFVLISIWNSNRSQRLCELYAVKPGVQFALKCIIATTPGLFVFITYLCSIPYFGYMLRVAEKPTERAAAEMNTPTLIYSYSNSMWCVIITMTTVGYGDYYPVTFLGRLVIFFVSIWGTLIMSLVVVTLTKIFAMNNFERRAFLVINRLMALESIKESAANLISSSFRAWLKEKKTGKFAENNFEEFKQHMKKFRNSNRSYRELGNSDSQFEEMSRQFDMFKEQLKLILKHNQIIMESNKNMMSAAGVEERAYGRTIGYSKSTVTIPKTKASLFQGSVVQGKTSLSEANSPNNLKGESGNRSQESEIPAEKPE